MVHLKNRWLKDTQSHILGATGSILLWIDLWDLSSERWKLSGITIDCKWWDVTWTFKGSIRVIGKKQSMSISTHPIAELTNCNHIAQIHDLFLRGAEKNILLLCSWNLMLRLLTGQEETTQEISIYMRMHTQMQIDKDHSSCIRISSHIYVQSYSYNRHAHLLQLQIHDHSCGIHPRS